ncbi:ribosomal protein S9/S16 [Theileria orientalis strain Shintoku]|uniref:Ribosomal protein S9/S16 n=1 Tax=Theileria orientalis strain Shintoku TaxID=869250 RepID=J4CCV9_THEOR|nr:ribosomal protein S9/S16 [Theileria orientalis strain Shintoku]BAM40072.1 ribosomal protein S9/S16 [Theileria orientalis strain Shintoku]|eukprot:XP_009690373.1 ribosomal protein S9/S16 [Theileria orientalis strain Shintoku]
MLNHNIFRFKRFVLIFLIFCTIPCPSYCFIVSSKGLFILKSHIYRSPCKIDTLKYSKKEGNFLLNNRINVDSSDEDNQTYSLNSEDDNNSVYLDLDNKNDSENVDFLPNDSSQKSGEKKNNLDFDKFEFDPETYKKMVDSFALYKGPSYSLSEYNRELPEGCKTIADFLEYPRNYNFFKSAEIVSQGIDYGLEGSLYDDDGLSEVKRMEGPYLKSSYETMGKLAESTEKRYTTREDEEDEVEPEKMYDILKDRKKVEDFDEKQVDEESENVNHGQSKANRKDDVPLSKINPNYFMFDSHGHLQYYLKYINDYKYDLFSYHNKNEEKPSFYLNYEYTKKIERPFPPSRDHTEKLREYFISLLPTLMDRLVELIKNDPNKNNTPSPPMHDLSLLLNFNQPKYLFEDEDEYDENGNPLVDKDQKYYEKYASLKGIHEPENDLIYPYSNTEPVLLRKLLSTYLEMHNTRDLGPLPTYRKYKSRSKYLKAATFPTHTKPPEPISDIDHGNYLEKWKNLPRYEIRTKLYERGKKKRGQAMVYLEPGNGNIIINNKDGYQYVCYNEFRLREILEPLSSLRLKRNFNIVAKAHGGGISGQSVAIRHALVKYLYRILSPKLKPILRKFDLVSIDRRRVERKKTNLRKARKKEMYSKR